MPRLTINGNFTSTGNKGLDNLILLGLASASLGMTVSDFSRPLAEIVFLDDKIIELIDNPPTVDDFEDEVYEPALNVKPTLATTFNRAQTPQSETKTVRFQDGSESVENQTKEWLRPVQLYKSGPQVQVTTLTQPIQQVTAFEQITTEKVQMKLSQPQEAKPLTITLPPYSREMEEWDTPRLVSSVLPSTALSLITPEDWRQAKTKLGGKEVYEKLISIYQKDSRPEAIYVWVMSLSGYMIDPNYALAMREVINLARERQCDLIPGHYDSGGIKRVRSCLCKGQPDQAISWPYGANVIVPTDRLYANQFKMSPDKWKTYGHAMSGRSLTDSQILDFKAAWFSAADKDKLETAKQWMKYNKKV